MNFHNEETDSTQKVLSMPYLLQQIMQFFPPQELVLSLQFLNKAARQAIHSENQFLRWSIKNALGQWHDTRIKQKGQEELDKNVLTDVLKAYVKALRYPLPI